MRNQTRGAILLGLGWVALLALTACGDLFPSFCEPEGPANVTWVDEQGYTDVDLEALGSALADLKVGTLSEPELEAILYMREGEKLARDVLLALDEQWDAEALGLVAKREETHTAAIKALIDRYELWDPMSVTSEGQYASEELHDLHYELVAQGSPSLIEALKVGLTIEEISILDLREYRAETDDEDVLLVYENLLRGSRNHLRIFAALLVQQGETVERRYLSRTLFDEIVNTPPEPGFDVDDSGG